MGNAINHDALQIWRELRRHGGWWTVRQVVQHWHPTFAPWEIEQVLQALATGRYLTARDDVNPGKTSYAFTSDCQALPGAEDQPEGAIDALHG